MPLNLPNNPPPSEGTVNRAQSISVVAMGVAIGLRFSMDEDLTEYFNEALGRSAAKILEEDVSVFP